MAFSELDLSNYQAFLGTPGILIVDAWASWCGPCRAFAPIFEAAAQRHSDVTWAKLDTEQQPELAGALGIRALPTLLVFRDGILVLRQVGMLPARALDELVQKVRTLDMSELRRTLGEQGRAASGAEAQVRSR